MIDPEHFYETPLPAEVFDEHLRAALAEMKGPHGDEIAEYIAWFLRRYPTPLERLKYTRRKYQEAMRTQAMTKAAR
jgi:hypothetical protein